MGADKRQVKVGAMPDFLVVECCLHVPLRFPFAGGQLLLLIRLGASEPMCLETHAMQDNSKPR